jgi:hypothetical protein
MGIDSHLSTCVGTQSPKYLEMAQGHISLSQSLVPSGLILQRTGSQHVFEDLIGPFGLTICLRMIG